MKSYQVFLIALIFVIGCKAAVEHSSSDEDYELSMIEDEDEYVNDFKVSSGMKEKKKENLEFCWMNVTFQNQWQLCGCVLIDPQWIVTNQLCVYDFVEGLASHINITFPEAKKKERKNTFSKIVLHDTDNIALVKLTLPMTVDNKKVRIANVATDETKDKYVGTTVVTCGVGSIDNYPIYPKKPMCTNLTVIAIADCMGVEEKTFCTVGMDSRNICNGDYGGPIYINSYDSKGKVSSQQVIGISTYSPDFDKNAPCKDGHHVVSLQLAYFISWWKMIIASNK